MVPKSFDIYLLPVDGQPPSMDKVQETLAKFPLRSTPDDPDRAVYHNPDTGTYFQLLLGQDTVGDPEDIEEDADGSSLDEVDETPSEDETETIEMAPVTLTVPLLCPTFLVREAVTVAQVLARVGNLAIGYSDPNDEEAVRTARDEAGTLEQEAKTITNTWELANREAAVVVQKSGDLTVWEKDKSESWWTYGTARLHLETELSAEGVHVPRLQAAYHEGRVKTLSTWTVGTPVLLPRTDLVLIRRERPRKGLFSRAKVEEGLVTGEAIWTLLQPSSEFRATPVELLIFRDADPAPGPIAAKLETLELEPLDTARRTELTGVVDCELPSEDEP